MSNYTHYKVRDENKYPFTNFKTATVEVWEWIGDFILQFTGLVIATLIGWAQTEN